jgi:hypothetical protein
MHPFLLKNRARQKFAKGITQASLAVKPFWSSLERHCPFKKNLDNGHIEV